MAHYHYLAKKLVNWKYIGFYHFFETRVCETQVCCETWVPKTQVLWKNILWKFLKFFYGTQVS